MRRAIGSNFAKEIQHTLSYARRRQAKAALTMKLTKALLLILPLALTTSCMVGPNYRTPDAKIEQQWTYGSGGSARETKQGNATWWKMFKDPVLNNLIEVAYRNNPTQQIAGVNILQARAQLNATIGNLFPQQQGLSGALNYTQLSLPDRRVSLGGVTSNFTADQLLFSSSWEIDFWGKFRRNIQSAQAAYLSTVASYDDALVTLIADVASTYVNIRTAEERIRVAQENAESQRESHRVAMVQFTSGETSKLDEQQAATLLAQTEAQVPGLQNTLNQAKNALAVLLGETPDKVNHYLAGSRGIPVGSTAVVTGIPRDLLRRRPDVREAGLNAAAQSALIGVSKANMLPALSLAGTFGFSSNNELKNSLGDIFMWQSKVAQAGTSFFWPVFNYGRLINQVRVQDAVFQQAVLNYQNTVLTAQQDVENSLSAYYTGKNALASFSTAANTARRASELSLIQYKAGETDFTTVLSSEQTQLSAEDSLASSQGNVALGLISIYRALGGGWEIRNQGDVISDDVKAQMRQRTNWGQMLKPEQHLPKVSPVEP
jgi:NodT family efflux transporter outer membrane factor (OMF) lipoprotein